MRSSVSHIIVEKISAHSLLQCGFGLFKVCGHSFKHSSLEVVPQHFNHVELWTLGHCNALILSFLSWCAWDHRPAARPNFSQGQMASHVTLEYFGIQRRSSSTQWLQGLQVLYLKNKPKSSVLHHCV